MDTPLKIEIKPYANNFEKLKSGALFRSIQKENGEPENIALGQISKELAFLQRQSQYVTEIDRVLKELRLTVSLIKGCRIVDVPEGVSRQELLAYYQGNFLTLVHQMKDKILQIVHLITEEAIPEKPSVEKDVSISDLLQKKQKALREIGIEEDIRQWEQENPTSGIAVALRKRTHHHHRVSGLRYDKDFLNLGFTDIATQPSFQENLSDYGKEHIEKMRVERTERLFSGAPTKTEDTLKAIEGNIEHLSDALVSYFKLPISQEEAREIITKQTDMLASFKVVNRCSIDKIPEPHKSILNDLVAKMRENYKDQIVAVYLVGSLGRGEYEEGYSDMNLYVVLNAEDQVGQALREDFMFSMRVFTQKQFLSDESKKFRIIAKADGILLGGTDLVKDEKLPKAGLMLALTLNDDIMQTFDNAKRWMEENPKATDMQISRKSRRLAKRLIDFMYAVAMSNKPQYTASRKERVEVILQAFPDKNTDKKVIDTLMGVSRYGVGEFASFEAMIEGFRPQAEVNLKKMLDVKNHIEKDGKK